MLKFGFFNSIGDDRLYNADDMSNYYDGLITNGIYKNIGDAFHVIPGTGMTLQVLTGRAIINCKWVVNDTFQNVTIDNADVNYKRIDAVVLRLDESNRQIILTVLKGTPASAPEAPAITDNDLCLAYINVNAGATVIEMESIEDKRTWVQGLISSNGRLKKYQNIIEVSTATTSFDVGIPEYNSETDILEVYRGGIYLIEGVDYTVNDDSIKMTESIDSGTLVFVVHKLLI